MKVGQISAIQIELTEQCNFNCGICYMDKINGHMLTINHLKTIAYVCLENGCSKVDLTGGEPTMHPQFVEIYEMFRNLGYLVNIYSNGSNITKEIKDIFEKKLPHCIEITVYGMSEDTYVKEVNKRNMYKRVVNNIESLIDMGANLFLKYNLTQDNAHEARQFQKIFSERVHITYNAQIIPKLNGTQNPIKKRLSPLEILSLEPILGVSFRSDEKYQERCEAGETLYITAGGLVRGCPVIKKGERIIDWNNPMKTFKEIRIYFNSFHLKNKDIYCPAWVELEGKRQVDKFMKAMK